MRVLVVGLVLACAASEAANITVCAACTAPNNTLQGAIDAASDGDTLILKAETYAGPIQVKNKSLTIEWEHYRRYCTPGIRLTAAISALMPKITATASDNFILRAGYDYGQITASDVSANTITSDDYIDYADGKGINFNAAYGKTLPSPLQAGVRYYIRDWAGLFQPFRLSLTKGGSAIDLTTAGDVSGAGRPQMTLADDRRMTIHIRGVRFEGETKYARVTTGSQINYAYGTILHLRHVHVYSDPNVWTSAPGASSGVSFAGASGSVEDSIIQTKKIGGEPEATGIGILGSADILIRNNLIEATGIGIITGGASAMIPNQRIKILGNYIQKPGYFFYSEGTGAPTGECFYDTATASGEFYRRTDVTQNCASGACYVCPANGLWSGVSASTSLPYFRDVRTSNKNLLELKNCDECLVIGNYLRNQRTTIDAGQGWAGGISVLCEDGNGIQAPHATTRNVLWMSNRAERTWAGWFIRQSAYNGCVAAGNLPLHNNTFKNNVLVRGVESWSTSGGVSTAMCERNNSYNPSCSLGSWSIQPGAFLPSDHSKGLRLIRNTARGEFAFGSLWNKSGRGNMDGLYTAGNLIQVSGAAYSQLYPNYTETTTTDCNATTGWGEMGNTKMNNDVVFSTGTPIVDFAAGACSAYASGMIYSSTSPQFPASTTDIQLPSSSPYSASNASPTQTAPDGGDVGADQEAERTWTDAAAAGIRFPEERIALKISRSGTTITASAANHGDTCTLTLYSGAAKKASQQTGTSALTPTPVSLTSQPAAVWWRLSCSGLGISASSIDPI